MFAIVGVCEKIGLFNKTNQKKLENEEWLNTDSLIAFSSIKQTSFLSLWQKAEVVPKQKELCSHCSFWPPTKAPLEKHSPWNYQTTSPPRLRRPTETSGPNTSCPSPERLSNSMNTLRAGTLGETRPSYSASSEPKLFIHTHSREENETGRHAALTGYFQWGVVAHCFS